ncbi:MAG: hypothetical protein ABIK73_06955 [candidate division WOR-3 bacterium]
MADYISTPDRLAIGDIMKASNPETIEYTQNNLLLRYPIPDNARMIVNDNSTKVYEFVNSDLCIPCKEYIVVENPQNPNRILHLRFAANGKDYTVVFDTRELILEDIVKKSEFSDVCLQKEHIVIDVIDVDEKRMLLDMYSIYSRKKFRIYVSLDGNIAKNVRIYPLER